MRVLRALVAVAAALCALDAELAAAQPTEHSMQQPLVMQPRHDMQIDSVRGVYYKHVMKTGGSTMDEMLWLLAKNRSIEFRTSENPRAEHPKPEEAPHFIKLVTLREPISRVISHYWQVKPWGNHTGGAHRTCRVAATSGYDSYLLRCQYSRAWQSKYFSSLTLNGASLPDFLRKAFDLVILSEFYDEGIVAMHYKFGFTVYDLLYMFRKVRRPPKLELTDEQLRRTMELNMMDIQLYREAVKVWEETMREVLDEDAFKRAVTSYKQLVLAYNDFMQPLVTQEFAVKARQDPEKLQEFVRHKATFCESDPRCRLNNLLPDV